MTSLLIEYVDADLVASHLRRLVSPNIYDVAISSPLDLQ